MKVTSAVSTTVLLTAITAPSVFAQNIPTCASNDSDPDGDGFGWENNASCIVGANTGAANTDTNRTGQCQDSGSYPWGWNPVTRESCRLDQQQQPSTSNFTDAMKSHLTGRWSCNWRYLEPNEFNSEAVQNGYLDNGCRANPSRRGLTYSTCDVQWKSGGLLTSGGRNVEGLPVSHYTQRETMQFNANGTYESFGHRIVGGIDVVSTTGDQGSWDITNNGHQLWIDNQATHRMAFETFNGTEYFSWYEADETRMTCKRE